MGTKSASNCCLLEKSQLPPPVWEVIVPLISRVDEEMNYKSLWTEQYRHLIETRYLGTHNIFLYSYSRKSASLHSGICSEVDLTKLRISIIQVPVRRLLLNFYHYHLREDSTFKPCGLEPTVPEALFQNSGYK